jgi:hypothetical protein
VYLTGDVPTTVYPLFLFYLLIKEKIELPYWIFPLLFFDTASNFYDEPGRAD